MFLIAGLGCGLGVTPALSDAQCFWSGIYAGPFHFCKKCLYYCHYSNYDDVIYVLHLAVDVCCLCCAVRVAETLGPEKALQLLYCTEDLEEAGGLMTLV